MKLHNLLQASATARKSRLRAADMLTIDQAAERIGVSRDKVASLHDSGRAVGLRDEPRQTKLSAWQFDPPIWNALERLGPELGATDGWALLVFLETLLGGLGGRTPRAAIEQGDAERVLALARHLN